MSVRQPAPPRFLPFGWLRGYERDHFLPDLVAGLTVAVMLVPQGLAYATLAGMPPITGLYASVAALTAYAAFGSSRHLAIGPVALTALVSGSGLASLEEGVSAEQRVALAGALALLVGALQILMGALRLGVLVNFLSNSVLAGFISAAAIVIGTSQVRDLLGLHVASDPTFLGTLQVLLAAASGPHAATTAIAGISIAVLMIGPLQWPRVPWPLVVVVLATVASAGLDLSAQGVPVLGTVPAGLPLPHLPDLVPQSGLLVPLFSAAGTVALISYMEAISNGRAVANRTRQPVSPNQELVAMGAANLTSGLAGAFPVGGSFSRTIVNLQAGGRSQASGLIAALTVTFVLLLLTPYFYALPRAVLAAIVVVAVLRLADPREMLRTWQVRRVDGLAALLTFAVTLIFGVAPGIGMGVAFSLGAFVYRSANPRIVEMGRVEGTLLFRDARRFAVRTDPAVAIVRMDAPLYFANAKFLADRVLGLLSERPGIRHVLLDASPMVDVDADGARTLQTLYADLRDAGVALSLVTLRGPVRDVVGRTGLWQELLRDGHYFRDLAEAVETLDLPEHSPLRPRQADELRPADVF